MIIEYKKENEIAFEKIKDKECFLVVAFCI